MLVSISYLMRSLSLRCATVRNLVRSVGLLDPVI